MSNVYISVREFSNGWQVKLYSSKTGRMFKEKRFDNPPGDYIRWLKQFYSCFDIKIDSVIHESTSMLSMSIRDKRSVTQ